MHFCFIIEAEYKTDFMPGVVAEQLVQWGHSVDRLEPDETITCLSELVHTNYDAYVLKTVSDGPGFSILEAVESIGIPTINHSRAIRLVRNKAVATVFAQARGLPVPHTYFVARPHLLPKVPASMFPLVIKPTNGSSGRDVYQINTPSELAALQIVAERNSFFLAQQYVENTGFDIKLYVIGKEVYSVAKQSPLHPEIQVDKQIIPITLELRKLALRVGEIFGLDIYGLDVVETASGLMVVDINDFPSFGLVPNAASRVANYILHMAERTQHAQHAQHAQHTQHAQHAQHAQLQQSQHLSRSIV